MAKGTGEPTLPAEWHFPTPTPSPDPEEMSPEVR